MLRIAALLTLCLCSLASAAEPYHKAVVRVDAGRGFGSGTVVAKQGEFGIILTCHHVVSAGRPHVVQFAVDGPGSPASVIASHPQLDVSALYVRVPEAIPAVPLASQRAAIGDPVELCGYGGGRWAVTRSTVKGYFIHRYAQPTDIGIAHISIPGESGGPILCFEDGEPRLAAVNWGGPTATEYSTNLMRFSQGSDSEQIRAWLRTAVAPKFPWVLPAEIEVRGAE
jgi:hypothetical protein